MIVYSLNMLLYIKTEIYKKYEFIILFHTMSKPKIAISLDKSLLELVDSKVDGSVIRSRSQAMEFFLRKGLQDQSIDTAVLMIKGEHQKNLFKDLRGKSLIKNQIEFFAQYGINNIYIITQHTKDINLLLGEISGSKINVEIVEIGALGNAQALQAVKDLSLIHI